MCFRRIVRVLSAIMDMQFAVNSILRDMRFKVPVDLDKKYHFLQETGFVQVPKLLDQPFEYVFRSEVDYYKFLMLHFISANPNVALCECCGRYFIPKTAKKTLYCDRIIKDNKTCKNLAPGLKHKLQAQNKKVVEEFDRAKQKMYKRYERALDPDKKVTEKDLSYAEYYEWLDQATQARDAYLAGRLSEEDALKAITSIFVSASLDRIDAGRTASVWKNERGLSHSSVSDQWSPYRPAGRGPLRRCANAGNASPRRRGR